jgi:hypothetical protein
MHEWNQTWAETCIHRSLEVSISPNNSLLPPLRDVPADVADPMDLDEMDDGLLASPDGAGVSCLRCILLDAKAHGVFSRFDGSRRDPRCVDFERWQCEREGIEEIGHCDEPTFYTPTCCPLHAPIASGLVVGHQEQQHSSCACAAGEAWSRATSMGPGGGFRWGSCRGNESSNTANTTISRPENVVDVLYGRRSEKRLVVVAPAHAMHVSRCAVGQ